MRQDFIRSDGGMETDYPTSEIAANGSLAEALNYPGGVPDFIRPEWFAKGVQNRRNICSPASHAP